MHEEGQAAAGLLFWMILLIAQPDEESAYSFPEKTHISILFHFEQDSLVWESNSYNSDYA
ncbi:hypothetical protein GCM10008922_48490 [Faecalicatena contorta]